MAGFLSNSQISMFTGLYGDKHFNTFSKSVVIYKEPQKTIINNPSNVGYGYGGTQSAPANYTLTIISGMFDAQQTLEPIKPEDGLEDIKNTIPQGSIRIKVKQNARDFIEDGRKNEKLLFAGDSFNFITADGVQNFLGYKFYIYRLQKTN